MAQNRGGGLWAPGPVTLKTKPTVTSFHQIEGVLIS